MSALTAEFWYATILFGIGVIGAVFGVTKLVFTLGKFTESLDNNLDASTETLIYVKGIDKRLIVVEANYVKEKEFNQLSEKVVVIETKHNMNHGKEG